MNILVLSFKSLKRKATRTILTIIGVAVATATLFSLLSFSVGYDRALKKEMQDSGLHMLVSTEGCPTEAASLALHGGEIPKYVDEKRLSEVRSIPGVHIATGMLIFSLTEEGGRTSLFYGIDEDMRKLKPYWKLEGHWFTDENSIILGAEAAKVEKRMVGDKIFFPSLNREFNVVGILNRTGTEDDGFFFLPLKTAQEVFHKNNKLTGIGVNVGDPTRIGQVKDRIEQLPDLYVVTSEQMMGQILKLVGSSKTLMFAVLIIVLIISIVSVLNTVLMSVMEMIKEFGYMRCVGASGIDIFKIVLIETLVLCLIGGGLGVLSGSALSTVTDHFIRGVLPYAPAGKMIVFDPIIFVLSIFFTVIVGVIAGLYPSFKASRVTPMEAIRNE
ncbi:MAG: ABC transporter permease [Candidatus Omnitrophica bacterium]|nr:ABC transporter permease [Candidatus Omnitrophota bacterium]